MLKICCLSHKKEYQEYLEKMNDWELKGKTLVGSEIKVDSLKFFKAELEYIDNRLNADLIQLKSERNDNIQNLYLYLVKKKKKFWWYICSNWTKTS